MRAALPPRRRRPLGAPRVRPHLRAPRPRRAADRAEGRGRPRNDGDGDGDGSRAKVDARLYGVRVHTARYAHGQPGLERPRETWRPDRLIAASVAMSTFSIIASYLLVSDGRPGWQHIVGELWLRRKPRRRRRRERARAAARSPRCAAPNAPSSTCADARIAGPGLDPLQRVRDQFIRPNSRRKPHVDAEQDFVEWMRSPRPWHRHRELARRVPPERESIGRPCQACHLESVSAIKNAARTAHRRGRRGSRQQEAKSVGRAVKDDDAAGSDRRVWSAPAAPPSPPKRGGARRLSARRLPWLRLRRRRGARAGRRRRHRRPDEEERRRPRRCRARQPARRRPPRPAASARRSRSIAGRSRCQRRAARLDRDEAQRRRFRRAASSAHSSHAGRRSKVATRVAAAQGVEVMRRKGSVQRRRSVQRKASWRATRRWTRRWRRRSTSSTSAPTETVPGRPIALRVTSSSLTRCGCSRIGARPARRVLDYQIEAAPGGAASLRSSSRARGRAGRRRCCATSRPTRGTSFARRRDPRRRGRGDRPEVGGERRRQDPAVRRRDRRRIGRRAAPPLAVCAPTTSLPNSGRRAAAGGSGFHHLTVSPPQTPRRGRSRSPGRRGRGDTITTARSSRPEAPLRRRGASTTAAPGGGGGRRRRRRWRPRSTRARRRRHPAAAAAPPRRFAGAARGGGGGRSSADAAARRTRKGGAGPAAARARRDRRSGGRERLANYLPCAPPAACEGAQVLDATVAELGRRSGATPRRRRWARTSRRAATSTSVGARSPRSLPRSRTAAAPR